MKSATIVFKKGSKKPWKVMLGAKQVGEAVTKAKAEELSKSSQKYEKVGKKGGIDEIIDETIEASPAPIKSAIAKTAGRKPFAPGRGQMEGEAAMVDEYEDEE